MLKNERKREKASGVVVKPLLTKNLNENRQVDTTDRETMRDGRYRFIFCTAWNTSPKFVRSDLEN